METVKSNEAVAVLSPGSGDCSILMKAYKFQALDGEIELCLPNLSDLQLFSAIAFLTYAGWNLQFSFRSETFSEANIV